MGGVNIHEECLPRPTCRFENKKLQFNAVHYATPSGFAYILTQSPGFHGFAVSPPGYLMSPPWGSELGARCAQ